MRPDAQILNAFCLSPNLDVRSSHQDGFVDRHVDRTKRHRALIHRFDVELKRAINYHKLITTNFFVLERNIFDFAPGKERSRLNSIGPFIDADAVSGNAQMQVGLFLILKENESQTL
jgi:hypothetical protein